MKALTLVLTILLLLFLFVWSNIQRHERIHQHLIVGQWAIEGAVIATVVQDLRDAGALPLDELEFIAGHADLCSIKWQIIANSNRGFTLGLDGKPIWLLDRKDGKIQRIGGYSTEEAELLPAIKGFDFSQSYSESNKPSLGLEFLSHSVWRDFYHVPGRL